jgi:hypothetical protein
MPLRHRIARGIPAAALGAAQGYDLYEHVWYRLEVCLYDQVNDIHFCGAWYRTYNG